MTVDLWHVVLLLCFSGHGLQTGRSGSDLTGLSWPMFFQSCVEPGGGGSFENLKLPQSPLHLKNEGIASRIMGLCLEAGSFHP